MVNFSETQQAQLFIFMHGCFFTTNAEWSTCNTDCMANKAKFIYYLTLCIKIFPTPFNNESMNSATCCDIEESYKHDVEQRKKCKEHITIV